MTSTAFVTGGTGLVGAHLLYDLLQKGYKVRALKRISSDNTKTLKIFGYYSPNAESLFQKIEWVDAGLLDFASMSEAVEGCDQMYHAAAMISFNSADHKNMFTTNIQGTANVVNVCLEKQIPLCQVSSIGALGRSEPGGLTTENNLWQTSRGRSDYAYSKYKSEMEVWRGIAEGLQATIVNPAVILGPGDWEKGSSSFFSRIHKGTRFYTQGVTGFIDVRDVSRCMIALMEQKHFGERYILSSKDLSYQELFDMIAERMHMQKPNINAKAWMLQIAYCLSWITRKTAGKKPSLTKETMRSALQRHCYSNEKIKSALSYEFIPLERCVHDCCVRFLQDMESSPC